MVRSLCAPLGACVLVCSYHALAALDMSMFYGRRSTAEPRDTSRYPALGMYESYQQLPLMHAIEPRHPTDQPQLGAVVEFFRNQADNYRCQAPPASRRKQQEKGRGGQPCQPTHVVLNRHSMAHSRRCIRHNIDAVCNEVAGRRRDHQFLLPPLARLTDQEGQQSHQSAQCSSNTISTHLPWRCMS